jgi:hypothetical protein
MIGAGVEMQPFVHVLALFLAAAGGAKSLDKGSHALQEFRGEDAVVILERAKSEGPYTRADHIRLYELLGIAYAYVERSDDALAAFDTLLALDPGRAISYTLSPKVTFLFEQQRGAVAERIAPTIDVRWPVGLSIDSPIPIDVEVVSDPKKFFARAKLFHRVRGALSYEATDVELPKAGESRRIDLPPGAPGAVKDQTVEIYLVAYDSAGNEVYQWGSDMRPREISVRFEPPDPWYGRWWVWAIAGTVVAAGASVAVFAVSREPEPTVPGSLEVFR